MRWPPLFPRIGPPSGALTGRVHVPRNLPLQVAPAAAALALVMALHAGGAAAAGAGVRPHAEQGSEAMMLVKPAVGGSKTANPSHVVNEGGAERPLWIDTSRVVEFPQAGGTGQPAIRAAEPGEVSESTRTGKLDGKASDIASPAAPPAAPPAPQVSPVFVDASGQPRALPGGIIVGLKQGLREAQAREQLQAAGLAPLRQIGERMWLVESPLGLASLELANRLHATGQFDFVQPNWWQPRTTK